MANFDHSAYSDGTFQTLPLQVETNLVSIALIDDITATLSADKQSWANGPLTLTVTINNTSASEDYTALKGVDVLDTTTVSFVENSVEDGSGTPITTYTYTAGTGTLEVPIADLAAGASYTYKFKVNRV